MTDPSLLIGQLLARCSFPQPTTPVTCAVSGGADSLALLVLAHAHGLDVHAVHVDHGLRAASHRDIDQVRAVADPRGIPVVVHTFALDDGPNLEARARDARRSVLPRDAMTGHTADDQAETVLINLMRGAASTGLSAMTPGPTRPILGLRRSETHDLCRSLGIVPVDDETNTDLRFQRNRVRHELLPLIADISRRDPVPILARTADVLRDDDTLLEELSLAIDPADALALAAAPLPLARRAVRRWLSNPYPPDVATIDRVLEVARGGAIACEIGENRRIHRSKQKLYLQNVE